MFFDLKKKLITSRMNSMKKILLPLLFVAFALVASAKVEYKSLNNNGNSTTIVFTISENERDATNGLSVDNIVFECDGKRYTAKKVDGVFGTTTTVTAKFKKIKKFSNARLFFTVNGEERSIDIQKYLVGQHNQYAYSN